ncbi:hypothetical protein Srot_1814 [Segniliparus rotundus DSM 44985]|uniref:YtxH domain-containing protein n=1 Tax=Segniliparus rotundus (strain ATCC BAA-972 / CDC 1076 / CIP 108378 / DSM 44985 / JCM 13578) TaxID=640132 RepID=D6Z8J4_SEGRD|nr:hypothetical protein [Segniliparus rotundus]ADG98274.1 hypothetical protein Srot_1814 [Segniliparus rotundus DSM 44985]
MIRLLIAAGIGYVFGARAGRERYAQLVRFTKSLQSNPLVAEAIATARKQAAGALSGKPATGSDGSAN